MAIKKIDSFNKHQNPSTNQNPFDVENYLNVNWDKTQEVVNNNADELKTAQNNISEIKQEQITQNTDIENIKKSNEEKAKEIDSLKKELEQTKTNLENYAIHGKSTGEYIHLTDSSETDCRVDVRGNSKQATREGYNELLQNRRTNTTTKGITVVYNEDGTIKASGTATDNTDIPLCGQWDSTVVQFVLKKGTHRLNLWTNVPTLFLVKGTSAKSLSNQKDLVLTEDYEVTNAFLRIAKGASINATIKPLLYLYEGQDKPYEQHGVSPSLDYPSKIETVKGSVKVTSSSANTLDLTKLSITEKPNVEIDSISANEVTFHTTNNTASSYYLRFKTILKKGTYYARKLYNLTGGTAVTGNNGSGVIFISKSDWSKEFIRLYSNVEKGSFSLQEDTEVYITLMLGKVGSGKIRFYNLMLANSDVNYVQHKEDSVVLPIQEEMLEGDYLDKVNKKEIHGWEKKVLNGTEKWINTGNTKTEKTLHLGIGYANSELLSAKINCKCENLKVYTADYLWNNEVEGIAQSKSQIIIRISKEKATNAEELKTFLAKNNITVYCKSVKRELPCTQEQIQALEKLDKLKTYKNITNITTDSIAMLDVDYKKDLETLLNQKNPIESEV